MEGRQLAAMCLVELLFLTVLGWPMWRRLSAPLLYLFFLVPFGAFIVARAATPAADQLSGLNSSVIPNFSDGYTIEIPAGTFYVAEACAGLRFLIAAIAFGVCVFVPDVSQPSPSRALHGRIGDRSAIIASGLPRARDRGPRPGSGKRGGRGSGPYDLRLGVFFGRHLPPDPDRASLSGKNRIGEPPQARRNGQNENSFAGSLLGAAVLGLSAMVGPVTAGRLDDGANGKLARAAGTRSGGSVRLRPNGQADGSGRAGERGAFAHTRPASHVRRSNVRCTSRCLRPAPA